MKDQTSNRPLPCDSADLAALKRWHQGSAILDADGEPLVVYHGSYVRTGKDGQELLGNIHSFDRNMSLSVVRRSPSVDAIGSWFSSTPGEGGAGMYGTVIYPAYLRITRPKYYETFAEFTTAFHEAAGRPPTGNGLGDPGPLRELLQSLGYDGICLARTNTAELQEEREQLSQAVRNAKDEAWAAPKHEREIYYAKVKRLEESHARICNELKACGESTEFDNQITLIAFDPEQIKSAIGSDRTYDSGSPYLTSMSPDAQAGKIVSYCQAARNRYFESHALVLQDEFAALGSLDGALGHFSEKLSALGSTPCPHEKEWLEGVFSGCSDPFVLLAERLIRYSPPLSGSTSELSRNSTSHLQASPLEHPSHLERSRGIELGR